MNGMQYVFNGTLAAMLLFGTATSSYAQESQDSVAPRVIEGEVVAANEDGDLVLRTERGMLAFVVPPEEIQGVGIGDVVRVPVSDTDQ